MRKYIIALLQMDSQNNVQENLNCAMDFIAQAAGRGAKLVAMPENMNYLGNEIEERAEEIPDGRTFLLMSEAAQKYGLWLHCGTIYEKNPRERRPFNTTMIINPKGELVAKYRKIHPFDAIIPNGPTSRESDQITPGDEIVVAKCGEVGNIGLSVCYDMRFAELYRIMALDGAQIFMVPANFTMPTGKDHWETILRARAIENGCYLAAPAQYGVKPKFQAYANSMVIDPWGNVIARASNCPQVITAEIDLDYIDKVRGQLFTLENRRADIYSLSRVEAR